MDMPCNAMEGQSVRLRFVKTADQVGHDRRKLVGHDVRWLIESEVGYCGGDFL